MVGLGFAEEGVSDNDPNALTIVSISAASCAIGKACALDVGVHGLQPHGAYTVGLQLSMYPDEGWKGDPYPIFQGFRKITLPARGLCHDASASAQEGAHGGVGADGGMETGGNKSACTAMRLPGDASDTHTVRQTGRSGTWLMPDGVVELRFNLPAVSDDDEVCVWAARGPRHVLCCFPRARMCVHPHQCVFS
jgi:hypothetical protein